MMLARGRGNIGPRVAVNAHKAVIVWNGGAQTHGYESYEASVILAATRLPGRHWSRPRNISRETRWRYEPEGSEPQVALTRSGEAIAIWQADDEGHSTTPFIRSVTQPASETAWGRPIGIRGSIEGEAPEVGATPTGEAVAIWSASYNEESGLEVSSRPAKGRWRWAQRLDNPGSFVSPLLAVTPKGEAVGAWLNKPEGAVATLRVTTRTPGGRWHATKIGTSDDSEPSIVTEPGGRVRLVWTSAGLFGEEGEVVSSTHTPGGRWTRPISLAGEGLRLPGDTVPKIAVTKSGESIAAWQVPGRHGEGSAIREASKPRGGPWSTPTTIASSPTASSYGDSDLQLVVTPRGEPIAVFHAYDGARWVIEAATRRAK
jgi:hypothetical protein